jgi:hypothetical protein
MIEKLQYEHPEVIFDIHSVPDFGDGKLRKNYINETLPSFDTIITGNDTV